MYCKDNNFEGRIKVVGSERVIDGEMVKVPALSRNDGASIGGFSITSPPAPLLKERGDSP